MLILFVLMALAISLEFKYHNVFRHISKRMLPVGLELPKWFDQKILFHPSDWIAPLLLGCVLWSAKQRFVLTKEILLAATLPLFAALSIALSPLANYPILYFHLWQYLTMTLLFVAASQLSEEQRARVIKAVFTTLIVVGSFQAILAIAQYFTQHSFGLRWLGEPKFDKTFWRSAPAIFVPDGCLWIVDRWLQNYHPIQHVLRATGTLSHPNVLGGFLTMTSLITVDRLAEGRKWAAPLVFLQLVAMTVTFSRAALFAFIIGLVIMRVKLRPLLVILASGALIGFCFQEQIVKRGGIVNYNSFVKNSDVERLTYQTIALDMIAQKPLFGVGHQQFSLTHSAKQPGATHNIYLMWAAETGLLSLGCYLTLIGCIAWTGFQQRKAPYMPCLAGIFFGFIFIGGCDFYLINMQAGRLMFFLIGGLIAAHRIRKPIQVPA